MKNSRVGFLYISYISFPFVWFRRWMLSGPELSRIIQEFEQQFIAAQDPDNPNSFRNHEAGRAAQMTFHRQVNSFCEVVRRLGNPFLDDFSELVTIDGRDCVDQSVIESVQKLEEVGQKQYKTFVSEVIEKRSRSIHDPIKKNNLPRFGKCNTKSASKQARKISVLQNNLNLFAQLYIALQNRNGDMREFFCHEIKSFPPSLTNLFLLSSLSAESWMAL